MTLLKPLSRSIAALCPLLLLATSAPAAPTLYWDADGDAGNNLVNGTGLGNSASNVWNTALNNWWLSGAAADQAWTNSGVELAEFIGTPGAISLGTNLSAEGLIFDTAGFSLGAAAAQTLTLGGSGIVVNSTAGATTIGSANLGLTLSSAQSWFNHSAGLLTIGGAVNNGANLLTVGGSGNTTITGVIGAGAGGLTKIGPGLLTIGAATNTFTGAVSVNEGTLSFGSIAALGTNTSMNLGTASTLATLAYTGPTATFAKNIVLAGPTASATGQTITAPSGTSLTLSGVISGGPVAGATNTAITYSGGGTFLPNATNTFTGNVVVTGAGTKLVTSTNNLNGADAAGQLGSAGAHNYIFQGGAIFNQTANTINPTSASGKNWMVGAGGATFDIGGTAVLQLDDANQFSGTDDLTKTGTGTLILGAAAVAYTFTGANVNITTGALRMQNAGALGTVGTINIGATSGSGTAALQLSAGSVANTTSLVVRSGSSGTKTIAALNTTGTVAFNGSLTLNDNVTIDAALGGTLSLPGGITEAGGARAITKTGQGTLTLNGANAYTGGTTVSGGLLQFANTATAFPASGNFTLNAGGAIPATGPAGSGMTTVTEWLNSGRLTTGSGGVLALTTSETADINLSALGYNSLFLGSIGANSYTGTLTPGTGGYRFGGGTGQLTLPNTNAITGNNALTIGYTGITAPVVLAAANDYSGATTVNAGGVLTIQNSNSLGSTLSGTTVAAGGVLQLQGGITVAGETLAFTAVASTDPQPNALVNLSGNNEWTGTINTTLVTSANSRISSTAGLLTISGNVNVTGAAAQSLVLTGTGNGIISGLLSIPTATTAIIKTGAGTWTLSNASNSFSGAVQIQNGALSVPSISGALGSGTLIQLGNANASTGTIIYTGTGETTNRGVSLIGSTSGGGIQADNTAGVLKLTASLTVAGAASTDQRKTFTLSGSGTGEFAGTIPDAVAGTTGQLATAVTKSGNGTWTISGVNSYTGATTVTGGALNLNSALNSTTGSAVTVSGGTLNLNVASAVTKSGITVSGTGILNENVANAISGTATLTVSGTGTANLTLDNNYTGTTTVSGGLLKLATTGALPGGTGTTGGTSGLTFSGTGVVGLAAGDFTRALGTGTAQVQWTGGGGFAAFGGNRVVNLGGAGAGVTWASGSFVAAGGALILGSTSADGTITFQNPIDLNGATRTIQVDDGAAAVDAILGGTITGTAASSALTKTGAGTLQFTGTANSFTGALIIGNGAVNTADLAQLGGASFGLGTTTTVGTLNYSGGTATFSKAIALAAPVANATGNTINAPSGTALTLSGIISGGPTSGAANTVLTLNGGATYALTGTNTFTGNVVVSGAGTKLVIATTLLNNADVDSPLGKSASSHSYTFSNGATFSYNPAAANILNPTATSGKSWIVGAGGATFDVATGSSMQLDDNNQFSGIGDLTKTGGGILLLGSSTTGYAGYTGSTVNVNAGTLRLANTLSLGSASTINLGDTADANNVTLDIRNSSVIPATTALVVRSGSSGTKTLLNAAVNNGLDGPVTLNDNLIADIAATMTLNGAISGTGGINKTSAGTLVLGGANTFAGPMTITAGTVRYAGETAFGNGNPANWTTTNLVVNSGTTAAFNVGAIGEFNSADIDAIKVLGSATGGFKTGAILALDTTNAPGGVFTYSGFINPGGNMLNVAKQGTGTLELNQLSLHTGSTAINTGTLRLGAQNTLTGPLNFGGSLNSAPTTTVGNLELGVTNASLGVINVYTNTATANTMTIAAGQTLTSTGSVTLGPSLTSASTTVLNVVGGGIWNVTGSALTFRVGGNNNTTNASTATLDLSGLASFSASLGSTGAFRIANADGTATPGTPDLNTVTLAPTSTITAGTIDIGASSVHNSTNTLLLGTGLNTLNADNFNIGSTGTSGTIRSSGKLDYKAAGTGTVKIRGFNTTGAVTNLSILNSNAGTNTALTADFLLAGHAADVLATNLNVGVRTPSSGWSTAANTVNFSFDEGTFTAGPVTLGTRGGGGSATAAMTGNLTATMTLGGATAATKVTFGAMTMANNSVSGTFGGSTGSAIATLNIGGIGTTQITSLSMGNNTQSATGATGGTNATVNISGSTTTFTGTGNSITMATNAATAAAGATTATAALNIGGGATTLAGGISMANATLAANTSTSSISLTGGSLTVGGNIIRNATSLGTENTTLTVDGGTLDMAGFNIGTSAKPIGVSFQSGTLKNVGEINAGAGLVKTGSGTLILAGTNNYTGGTTISGGNLQVGSGNTGALPAGPIVNNATLTFGRTDAVTIATPITGSGTVAQDGGILNLNGVVTGQGLHVVNGQVKLGLGDTTAGNPNYVFSALTVDSGATAQITSAGGLKLVQATSLALAGALDLTGNAFVLDYAGSAEVTAQTAAFAALLQAGFNGGLWNGMGGINTSKVSDGLAANPTGYQFLTGIGYMPGALTGGSFLGRAVDAGSVVARYTYYGDANLDGVVNGLDYTLIDSGFANQNTPGFVYSWVNGDFNYDGKIDGADYALMDTAAAFSAGTPIAPAPAESFASAAPESLPMAAEEQMLAAAPEVRMASLPTAVPEPASFGLLALGGALLGCRRRRKAR